MANVDAAKGLKASPRAAAKASDSTTSRKRKAATTDTTQTASKKVKSTKTETAKKPAEKKKAADKKVAEKEVKPTTTAKKAKPAAAVKKTAPTAAAKKAADKKDAEKKATTVARRPKTDSAPSTKKQKVEVAPPTKKRKVLDVINEVPTKRLKVFVFGDGESGELGLGAMGKVTQIIRPKLNDKLMPATVGVVQIATGGMHAVALTHDNKILTWGVNDVFALGRDTFYDEDADRSDVDSDSVMSPLEATPGEADVSKVPEGTIWSRVRCGDSATFAITNTGLVFGCGTFRSSEGLERFSPDVRFQKFFAQVPGLKDIVDIACGSNHAIALDKRGNVFGWGWGQQMQLGRRIVERSALRALIPTPIGTPRGRTRAISSGEFHSFAIDDRDNVWAWGLNSFGETGIDAGAGEDSAVIIGPQTVDGLKGKNIVRVEGGSHHSIAVDAEGSLWAFGRSDASQCGIDIAKLAEQDPDAVVRDNKGRPRIIKKPTLVPGLKHVVSLGVGIDTNTVIDETGKAYSWGFSGSNQTGLGTEEDVPTPTLLEGKQVKDEKLVWAGAGGQFGMVASEA